MGFCARVATSNPVGELGLFSFVFFVTQCLTVVLILTWLWRTRVAAEHGVEKAARNLILPVYSWVLWIFCLTEIAQGVANITIPLQSSFFNEKQNTSLSYSAVYGSIWGANHFIIEGITFLLVQHGAGVRAQVLAGAAALVWGMITFAVHFYAFFPATSSNTAFLLLISWEALLSLIYFLIYILPQKWFFRRPALSFYSVFWSVFRATQVASLSLMYYRIEFSQCAYVGTQWVLFGVMKPFVIYHVLRQDSEYWRGIFYHRKKKSSKSSRQCSVSRSGSQASLEPQASPENSTTHQTTFYRDDRKTSFDVVSPLLGQHLEIGTARHIALGLDKINKHVEIINFAYLSLGKQYHILGAGGTSRVYRGTFKGSPVAIKIIYCMELTPIVVANFYEEAVLLSGLRHENIVNLVGISVAPPSLCLVMELCDSNLYEFIHKRITSYEDVDALGNSRFDNLHTKFGLAIGCAKGIAYLHNCTPPILHTDVKSLNFLVTSDVDVKLCDFEHCLRLTTTKAGARVADDLSVPEGDGFYRTRISSFGSAIPETLNWTAPEMVRSSHFSFGGDVYSLGIVIWEVFTGRVPFDELPQPAIRKRLLSMNYHPSLSPELGVPSGIADLLRSCWHRNPAARPKATEVVQSLQRLQHEMGAKLPHS